MSKGKDDKELSSFRISDKRRPEVRTSPRGKKAKDEPAPQNDDDRAFPQIETRVEKGTIESVADELRSSYEQLEKMSETGDMRSKGSAKKALAAYERTADLFEYLFATKDQMANK